MSSFLLRRTEPGDADALNDLYFHYTGIRRTQEQFMWEWFDLDRGRAPSWVVADQTTGTVVAHHGVIPVPLWDGEKPIHAARTENSMVSPAYARKVNYLAYESKILKELLTEFDLLFTTSGKGPQAVIRKRLGYRPVGRWVPYIIHEPLMYWVHRMIKKKQSFNKNYLWKKQIKKRHIWHIEITQDCERVNKLWENSKKNYGLSIDREVSYLEWRLLRHPYHDYTLAVLVFNGKDTGFLALKTVESGPMGREIIVEDAFTRENTQESYQNAFHSLRAHLAGSPTRVHMRMVAAGVPLCNTAARLASRRPFRPNSAEGAEFLVRPHDALPLNRPSLTMLTAEGIS